MIMEQHLVDVLAIQEDGPPQVEDKNPAGNLVSQSTTL